MTFTLQAHNPEKGRTKGFGMGGGGEGELPGRNIQGGAKLGMYLFILLEMKKQKNDQRRKLLS